MTDTSNKTQQSGTEYRTPESDFFFLREDIDLEMVIDFARKLERERDELKKHIEIMGLSKKTASDEYYKLAVEAEELEAEVELWKENATSNRGTLKPE